MFQRRPKQQCTLLSNDMLSLQFDGDNEFLTLKVDTSLNESMGLIQKGSVLRLTAFVPVCFRFSDLTDMNVAILTSNFVKMAQTEVNPKFWFPPKDGRLRIANMQPPPPSPLPPTDPPPSPPTPPGANKEGRCHGEQCSLYGVKFACCLTQCVPVDSKIMVEIARECPFWTMTLEEMDNSNRRFLLCCWHVTNVCSVTGGKNRAKLPKCLTSATRRRFPTHPTPSSKMQTMNNNSADVKLCHCIMLLR
jgi:hypothetical protein